VENRLYKILTENILPLWLERMPDTENGGFFGQIDGRGNVIRDSGKGAVLNARILWTFSACSRLFEDSAVMSELEISSTESRRLASACREAAERARNYLIEKFIDKEYGGVYWLLDSSGRPENTKKQFYAIGFAIYGLSEYYRLTGDKEALDYAVKLFEDIETHSYNPVINGYIEAASEDWSEIVDMRLSEKDENEKLSMNTHLHILEPYTNLYRVWRDDRLAMQLRNLILIFLDKIKIKESNHLGLFFDESWNRKGQEESYGHDIEASWLLLEAAEVLGDPEIYKRVLAESRQLAFAALEGLKPDGGMIYELRNDGTTDTDRHWWVQAETVTGLVYLYKKHKFAPAHELAQKSLDYIENYLLDRQNGEWFWSVDENGIPDRDKDKAGFWKCPYHNSRMCTEILWQLYK
jgi:mannobiose 2-epimerase